MSSLSFDNAAIVKIYRDISGDDVLGVIRHPSPIRNIIVSKSRMETRTREVDDPTSGEKRTESYTVSVPYTEVLEQSTDIAPRLEIPVEHTRIWTSRGELLNPQDAKSLLSSPKRCFYLTRDVFAKRKDPVDPFYKKMLGENVVIVWYNPRESREIPVNSR